ncbi:MAG TPA: LytTR family DNA-binding domain-containing protein [Chthoniobacteraceae bacterium]|nr:LytTR family DNA-binding domain-containing protein [Chthoniobacteraceae bacterium]
MHLPLRTLVVDDEAPARQQMGLLLKVHREMLVVGEADSVPTAAREVARLAPDVIFLDVEMPGGNGFDLLPLLDAAPAIVFVTAHPAFAVRAFEANALDYLLKPVHPLRLAATVQRLLGHPRLPEKRTPAAGAARLTLRDTTTLRDGRNVRVITISQIAWIEAEGIYSRVGLAEGGYARTLRSLGEWEQLLPTRLFARVERSLIVNLGRITALCARNRNVSELRFLEPALALEIGRTAAVKLRQALAGFGNGF